MTHAAIIGAGRLGTTLARALAGKGYRITGIACASLEEAEQSRLFIGTGSAFADIRRAAEKAELVILTVPDHKILDTARELAREENRWSGRMV
jgi:predicted dinucleotide-binding enzyme